MAQYGQWCRCDLDDQLKLCVSQHLDVFFVAHIQR